MYAATNREGRVLALTTEDAIASQLVAMPDVSNVRRLTDMESMIAEESSFVPVPIALKVSKLRSELEEKGLPVKSA